MALPETQPVIYTVYNGYGAKMAQLTIDGLKVFLDSIGRPSAFDKALQMDRAAPIGVILDGGANIDGQVVNAISIALE